MNLPERRFHDLMQKMYTQQLSQDSFFLNSENERPLGMNNFWGKIDRVLFLRAFIFESVCVGVGGASCGVVRLRVPFPCTNRVFPRAFVELLD